MAGASKRESSRRLWPSGVRIMAISTRWPRTPVTRPAHSPSMGMRPSRVRPSSVKNSMAASMSSTTMPTLSIRLTVIISLWRLTALRFVKICHVVLLCFSERGCEGDPEQQPLGAKEPTHYLPPWFLLALDEHSVTLELECGGRGVDVLN